MSFATKFSSSSSSLAKIPPLQTLLKRGFTPTLKSINQLLLFLSSSRRFNAVIHLYSQLQSNNINADSQTHSILTRSLLKLHRFEEAEHLINTQTSKSSNFPRYRFQDSLIQGFGVIRNNPEKGLFLLKDWLADSGTLPSSFTFRSLIHSFASQGNMDRAIEVLELMTGNVRYPFDNFVFSSVIAGFCKTGRPDVAFEFFKKCVEFGALRPNVVTYTALLKAFNLLGRFDEACDLVSGIEKQGLVLDVVLYSCCILGYFRNGCLIEALNKHREMVDRGINPDIVSYTILVDGFSREGSVEKAVGFLKKMLKDGVMPNVITYTAIMLGFCKEGKLEKVFTLFKEVQDMGIEVDEYMYATLIYGACRKGDFDCVFHLLGEMEKKGIKPSVITYNIVINGLSKVGRTSEADSIFKEAGGDIIAYSTLLHGYTEEENVEGIFKTKGKLEESGLRMDVVACNILIKALFMVGAFEDARALYQAMLEMDLNANPITYCTMIDGYCKAGRIEEALEVFDVFRMSLVSSVACYNCMISGLCKEGMVDMAIEVIIELCEKGLVLDMGISMMLIRAAFAETGAAGVMNFVYKLENFGSDAYNSLCGDAICFLCKRGFVEAASELHTVMRWKGLILMKSSYNLLLKKLIYGGKMSLVGPFLNFFLKEYGLVEPIVCKILAQYLCLKNMDIALRFLKKMKELVSTVILHPTVLKNLVKEGRLLDAYKLVLEARESFPAMDVVDYSILVHALCKEGYPNQALDLCAFAKTKGITPNIVTYNSVINGLCRQGCLIEALRLFDSLERIGLVPSTVTYATLIDNLCKQGLLLEAKNLFDTMINKGCKPNICVYNSFIINYCKFGRMDEALKLLSDLEIKGVKPDEFTVSALIYGYCKKGDMEDALTFYSEFKMKGASPDFLGYIHMVRGLCAKGRMEEARNILREMLQTKSVVELINNIDTKTEPESIESFLVFLCEQGSIQEALVVLNEIASILFPSQKWSNIEQESQAPNNVVKSEVPSAVSTVSAGSNKISGLHCTTNDPHKIHKLVEDCDVGKDESQFRDFGCYYSLLSSLCSKGEQDKVNKIMNEMISSLQGDLYSNY
ncbi:pentatricopeptide repeat-containing protein At5g57250, mitochondrial-like [Hibiscus syriacus]|uniref:pentatricopeptide repeat-containing protein At5g57250, mitochondrial-like n=1 Tax=Hibiscus syriacus TaxID=106335 RepID=UPI0019204F56|nr:pentatricopeptide repeat-containing protein At5g57250, mitochondrial-like [Hibiscus syriacus]